MTQPIKIAHVVLGLNVGGLERMVLRLIARTSRDRFTPIVCALDEPGELAPELDRLGVPLVVLSRRRGKARLALQLSAWLWREGIRVVHTHNPSPQVWGALGAALARWAGAPMRRGPSPRVVHTKHSRNMEWVQTGPIAHRLASSLTDRVVAVSEDARQIAIEVEHLDPARVVTILNGVDTEEYRPRSEPSEIRARLGVPLEAFHIGCVARLSPVKDHATLLAAFAALRRRRPDAHLTLIGDGELRAALEIEAARLGVEHAVTFTGTRHDIAELLPSFDVCAQASLIEGISLTLLEAAAAGLPVVATRVGGNAEVVDEGQTGLLVPPGAPEAMADALAAVARRSASDRAEMGRRGRARVIERFGADRMTRAYEELYMDVLSAG